MKSAHRWQRHWFGGLSLSHDSLFKYTAHSHMHTYATTNTRTHLYATHSVVSIHTDPNAHIDTTHSFRIQMPNPVYLPTIEQ